MRLASTHFECKIYQALLGTLYKSGPVGREIDAETVNVYYFFVTYQDIHVQDTTKMTEDDEYAVPVLHISMLTGKKLSV